MESFKAVLELKGFTNIMYHSEYKYCAKMNDHFWFGISMDEDILYYQRMVYEPDKLAMDKYLKGLFGKDYIK